MAGVRRACPGLEGDMLENGLYPAVLHVRYRPFGNTPGLISDPFESVCFQFAECGLCQFPDCLCTIYL